MRLLFDQNISYKIVKQLATDFPEAKQVRHVGLEDASDLAIFQYAKEHDFAIVTFDADFVDLQVIKGSPPSIIWLRTGNLTTKAISALLRKHAPVIQEFMATADAGVLEIIDRGE
ncbi:Predicted nuclease, contains PIN domain, potential toxin-antitoxin system component [Catalinimonas alkaloidigena]|uniref:Predicted nuclease, contains PIN domain, potential toxin-antitoxin system component n=1 Tax=Catalinimonas alkaloidigena TaxID=1075417 RepID=A0A1G9RPB8_9BACT|nr:DUF5615 family PIN-like protein [Catalinimonas alkaloidigena]SDM24295.1 Predicted nuclease, contains PIN domain, potential toxin-antitoxin system component [Catalinimonas alkaloidigena]